METKKPKILKAWWHSSNRVLAIFESDLSKIPEIKFFGNGNVGKFEVSAADKKLFSEYSSYFFENGKITFVLRSAQRSPLNFDCGYYVCGSFNDWENAIGNPDWKMSKIGKEFVLTVPYSRFSDGGAFIDSSKRGDILFKFADCKGRWLEPASFAPNVSVDGFGHQNLKVFKERGGTHMIEVRFESHCDWLSPMRMSAGDSEVPVDSGILLRHLYSDKPLGAKLHKGKTRFSIFAPRAKEAKVVWRRPSENVEREIPAYLEDGAVWIADASEDLSGACYMWRIEGQNFDSSTNFDPEAPVADPYALSMYSSDGECVVAYENESPSACFCPPAWHDLVIVEIHLRDVLANAKVSLLPSERLTFDGLTKWLSDPDCYLRKLGANCVELQPIQEFTAKNRSDYEWGYMPVNWFSPASSYSKEPGISAREDFAKLVEAFHSAGLAVILDVVYNHVGEPNYLARIDKEYYFELSGSGSFMNYSGCGNDFKPDAPMSRRMIIDSLTYLVKHFDVDGFRFDLAELLGLPTLLEIESRLKKIKPSIILIAEPWSFRGRLTRALANTGWASWNDGFREFMLKYALNQGNFDGFKFFVSGSRGEDYRFPSQTVNYLESHDDMCLFDRIVGNKEKPSEEELRRYRMALSLVLVSIGLPMLAEGCDLARTKGGLSNTYKNGQANALDYHRGSRFSGTGEWVRKFIAFRLSEGARALRLFDPPKDSFFKFFSAGASSGGVLFNADKSLHGAKKILALYNPGGDFQRINMDLDLASDFKLIADIDRFDPKGLDSWSEIVSANDEKKGRVTSILLAPVSLEIWTEK